MTLPDFSNRQRKRSVRSCYRKARHETLTEARQEAERLNRKQDGPRVVAYRCAACLAYHCGRTRQYGGPVARPCSPR